MTTTFSAGQKVRASQLTQGTAIARTRRLTNGTATTATTSATAQKLCELDAALLANHLYHVKSINIGMFSTAAAECQAQITYTTDGSTPTVTSTLLTSTQITTPAGSLVIGGSLLASYTPGSNLTIKMLVSYFCNSGATTVNVFGNTSWPFELTIEDMGIDPGDTGIQF
jgi:hypothetical protein